MPRDFMTEKALGSMPPLEKSPGNPLHMTDPDTQNMGQEQSQIVRSLHPFTQILTLKDVESCIKLEEATLPPEQRCSREKVSESFSRTEMACRFPLAHLICAPEPWLSEMWTVPVGSIS